MAKGLTMAKILRFNRQERRQFDGQVVKWMEGEGARLTPGTRIKTRHIVGGDPRYKCFECEWVMTTDGPMLDQFWSVDIWRSLQHIQSLSEKRN